MPGAGDPGRIRTYPTDQCSFTAALPLPLPDRISPARIALEPCGAAAYGVRLIRRKGTWQVEGRAGIEPAISRCACGCACQSTSCPKSAPARDEPERSFCRFLFQISLRSCHYTCFHIFLFGHNIGEDFQPRIQKCGSVKITQRIIHSETSCSCNLNHLGFRWFLSSGGYSPSPHRTGSHRVLYSCERSPPGHRAVCP